MARTTIDSFKEACKDDEVGAVRLWRMWCNTGIKGSAPKEKVFAAGVEAGTKWGLRMGKYAYQRMPTEPTEEILEAMQQAGARQDWSADIYRAIAQIINKEKVK